MDNHNRLVTKKEWIVALIAGLASAALYGIQAINPTLGSIIGIFAGIPLFVAGFGFGTVTVILSALIGTIGCIAMAPDIKIFGMYIIMQALPVTVLVVLALRKRENVRYPIGRIVTWLLAYIAVLFLIADAVLYFTSGVNLQTYLHDLMAAQMDNLIAQNQAVYDTMAVEQVQTAKSQMNNIMVTIANIYPGTFMISALLALAVNAVIAMHLLRNSVRLAPLRSTFDFNSLTLPHWVAVLTVVSALVSSFLGGHIGFVMANLSILLFAVEMLEGLAVIHAHAATKDEKGKKRLLWLVYLAIAGFFFPIFIVAGIGIIDHIKDFRKLRT